MEKKVLLISIDGMRPDGLRACGNPFVKELEKRCAYTYTGSSVFPSVTLPCHYSMTHSVVPARHGILSNTFVPQIHNVKGIFEKVREAKGVAAMFYGWEPLRDICNPGSLRFAVYTNAYMQESGDTVLTDECERIIDQHKPDLAFLYMVETDEKGGHDNGWMTEAYLARISTAIDNVKRMFDKYGDEYRIIIMADHGGHDRMHGTDMPEDMTIPFFYYGPEFTPGEIKENISLLEIAPTIAKLLGLEPEDEWEGKALF
jgi:predicted AlkP superfamily pyrophosphatase or phosphodiesterase